ncbi:MAG: MerR family transcriptional regulator [Bdellovibrio sp.]|nr:MerR family transcriptional regulator [Bdellovibrio sp.]
MTEYSIQMASRLSGVGIHTLRAWEKRYQAVVPQRSNNGRRVYSDQDISKLRMLNELCGLGSSIGSIANHSSSELEQLLAKFTEKDNKQPSDMPLTSVTNKVVSRDALSHLLLALQAYKLDVISHELNKLIGVLNPREFVFDVLYPLLQEVGAKVKQGEMTLAQEFAIASIVKFHVGHLLYGTFRNTRHSDKVFLFATPENNHHEFGILLCALMCVHYGHKFFYFGMNMPSEALIQAIAALEANYIILGTTNLMPEYVEADLNTYFTDILNGLKVNQKLVVGGNGTFAIDRFHRNPKFQYLSSLQHFDNLIKDL